MMKNIFLSGLIYRLIFVIAPEARYYGKNVYGKEKVKCQRYDIIVFEYVIMSLLTELVVGVRLLSVTIMPLLTELLL